jgi:hypothetical protein
LLLWSEAWSGEVYEWLHTLLLLLLLLLLMCTIGCLGIGQCGGWRGELKAASVTTLHVCSCRDLCNCGWLLVAPIM